MTTDKRLKTFIPITTNIYVLLHTKHLLNHFVLTGEDLVVQEDKITYDV